MKKLIPIFIINIILLFSCDITNFTQKTDSGEGGSGSAIPVSSKSIAEDANGQFLGYVSSSNSRGIEIYTEKGFFVSMDWVGDIKESMGIYATKEDGGGSLFHIGQNIYGKTAFMVKDKLYKYKDIDEFGIASGNPLITEFNSFCGVSTEFMNIPGTVVSCSEENDKALEFIETTKSEIGFPESFSLPITLVWE